MAQKKKKKKRSQPPARQRRRLNVSQMVFIAFGVIVILSMVISLIRF